MESLLKKPGWKLWLVAAVILALFLLARYGSLPSGEWTDPLRSKGRALKLLLTGACATAVLIAIQLLWKPLLTRTIFVRNVLLLCFVCYACTLIFLLPPFQGPDEKQHWKFALLFYRHDAQNETHAYNLNEILEADRIPFHPENQFNVKLLRQPQVSGDFDKSPPPDYGYVRFHSYPFAALVSHCFPRAETVSEGLLFFYLCRIAPLLALAAMLYWANRKYELPYTALFLFTLPLLVQQSVIVSADPFLNIGTAAAALLFVRLRREPSVPLTVLLWALCLALAASKLIVAGILLLPMLLIPWDRIPRRRIVIPLAALAVLVVSIVAVNLAVQKTRAVSGHLGIEAVNGQLEFLKTAAGWQTFFTAYGDLMLSLWDMIPWCYPLGWLDTGLSGHHIFLIKVSLWLALLLDLARCAPKLLEIARARRGELLLIAGVIAAVFLFLSLSDALIYYVMGTPPMGTKIGHFQARHLFPALIVAVLLPLVFARGNTLPLAEGRVKDGKEDAASLGIIVLNSLAICVLPLLLFARQIEFTIDLLVRYW